MLEYLKISIIKIERMARSWDGNEMWSRSMDLDRLKVVKV